MLGCKWPPGAPTKLITILNLRLRYKTPSDHWHAELIQNETRFLIANHFDIFISVHRQNKVLFKIFTQKSVYKVQVSGRQRAVVHGAISKRFHRPSYCTV